MSQYIFITGNNSLMRQALKNLSQSMQMICVGEAKSGINLLDQITAPPDLFLLDLDMPYQTPFVEVISKLEMNYPSLKIATLSYQVDQPLLIHRTLTPLTTRGYILKGEPYPRVKEAIIHIAQGYQYCSPQIARIMLQTMRSPPLTRRETQVLALISKSNREIAKDLGISVNTVATYIKRIKHKLFIPTREGLVKLKKENDSK